MNYITVSIVSHGHKQSLEELLHNLENQDCHERLLIIITFNLNNENINPDHFKKLKITIIRNLEQKGFGANHNAAFKQCKTEWFLIVNPDIKLLNSHAISSLTASSTSSSGIEFPRIVNSNGDTEDAVRTNLSFPSLLLRAFYKKSIYTKTTTSRIGLPFFWVAGMFIVVKSDVFKEVNGFDERYFLYCEDYDLCARIYLSGYSISIHNDVQVVHDAQRDSHRSLKYLIKHIISILKVWISPTFWKITINHK